MSKRSILLPSIECRDWNSFIESVWVLRRFLRLRRWRRRRRRWWRPVWPHVKIKSSLKFSKFAQKVTSAVFTPNLCFSKVAQKVSKFLGNFCKKIYQPRTLKNCPIRSHWWRKRRRRWTSFSTRRRCTDGNILRKMVIFCALNLTVLPGHQVTRFGEILTLWQKMKS